MPAMTTEFSVREAAMLEEYAAAEGVSPEIAIKDLCQENLASRLRCRRQRGEVRTFQLPKKD